MERLVKRYADKLIIHGLCDERNGMPLLGGLDAELVWNREDPASEILEEVIAGLNINSILFARPSEPYFSILNYLVRQELDVDTDAGGGGDDGDGNSDGGAAIRPEDTETRTFLHDIPISPEFDADSIVDALKRRKSVIIPDQGIVAFGTVSPEQAFVTYSSVCFAIFVKFLTDHLYAAAVGVAGKRERKIALRAIADYKDSIRGADDSMSSDKLRKGPFTDGAEVLQAMTTAGRLTVEHRMVDSFFGNISYRLGDVIYISQTGSSLDELSGNTCACPMDGSSCAGITASSEYTAHRDIYQITDNRAILHGHPKFCVIMSLFCENFDCGFRGQCHIKCPEKRFIGDIPIVPGEVGTGPFGLCHTLPPAIVGRRGVIVYGHGLFTVGRCDFTDALSNLVEIEKMCIDRYLDRIEIG